MLIGHERKVIKSKPLGHICTPVSYTHLDVYKRQVYGLLIGTESEEGGAKSVTGSGVKPFSASSLICFSDS